MLNTELWGLPTRITNRLLLVIVIEIALLKTGNVLAQFSPSSSASGQWFLSSADSSLSEAGSRAILNEVLSRSLYGRVYSESRVSGKAVSKVESKHQDPPIPEQKLKEYVAATYTNATERERQMIVAVHHGVDVKVYQLGKRVADSGLPGKQRVDAAAAADALRGTQLQLEIDLLRNDALGNDLNEVLLQFTRKFENQ